jgi:hypothetical protein
VALGMKEDSDRPRGPSTKPAMSMIIEPLFNAYAITDNEGRDRAGGRAAGDGRENLPEESMIIAPEFLLLDVIRSDKSLVRAEPGQKGLKIRKLCLPSTQSRWALLEQ